MTEFLTSTIPCTALAFDRESLVGGESFRVQILGIDPWGSGPYHPDFDSAAAYASEANGNGHSCVIHVA